MPNRKKESKSSPVSSAGPESRRVGGESGGNGNSQAGGLKERASAAWGASGSGGFGETAPPTEEAGGGFGETALPTRALRASEGERFFELSVDMLAVASTRDGRWKRVNRAFTRTLGWSEDELLRMPLLEIVHGEDLERSREAISSLAAGKDLHGFEHRVRCKDGGYRWVTWDTASYASEGLVYCVGRDITERRQMEEALVAEAADMRRLHELSLRLSPERDFKGLLQEILEAAKELLGSPMGCLQLLDPERGVLTMDAAAGYAPGFVEFFRETRKGQAACGTAWERLARVIVEDVKQDAIFTKAELAEVAGRAGFRAVCSTPLLSRAGELLGTLSVNFPEPHRPSERELRLLDLYCRQAAEVLELAARQREKERDEERLHASEERYRKLLRVLPAGMYTCDREGRIDYYNEQAARIWGREPQAGDGQERFCGAFRLYHVDGTALPHAETPMALALFDGSSVRNQEVVMERPDGSRVNVSVNIDPLRDATGRICGAINLFTDVTERKLAEEAVRESERFIRRVLDNLFAFVGVVTPDGTLIEANRAPLVAAGIAAEEVLGKKFWECYWWNYSREVQEQLKSAITRAGRNEVVRYDVPVRMAGERLMWIDFQISPLRDEKGRVTHLIPSAVDITARREAESELRSKELRLREAYELLERVTESTDDLIAALDTEFRFLLFNEAYRREFKRIFGAEARSGASIAEALAHRPEDQKKALELWGRALRGEAFEAVEQLGTEGSYYEIRCSALRDGERIVGAAHVVRDVTERRRAEEALRKSEQRLQKTLGSIQDGLLVLDSEWRYTYFSEQAARIIGVKREEMLGGLIWDLFPKAKGTKFYELYHRAVATGEAQHFEEFYPEPLNQWLECHCYPSGEGLTVYFRDVTERKTAEQRLQESELFYRQTLESIPGMVFMTRADGYCEYQSQQWVEYTGVPLEKHLGDGWNKLLHPEDRGVAYRAWRAAVEERAPYDLEYRVRRQDGDYEWFKVIGRPIRDTQGQIVRWFGVALNIQAIKEAEEALRESEERLRLAKAAGRIGIHDFNPITGELVWDEHLRELWGLGPHDPVNYEVFIEGVHPEDRAATHAAVKRGMDPAGDGQCYVEYRLVRGGRTRWIAATGQTTFREGRAVRFVGTVQDITQEKEFRAELERLVAERTAKLHELVGELEHFSYSITHDMRAPLRAMRGFAEVVNEMCADSPQPELKTFLRQIITSAERMDMLITDALDYSTTVRQDLRLATVDAGRLLEGMLDTYPQFLMNREHIRVEGKLPLVLANEAGLTQCFSNLIGNALKFVEAGKEPEVRVWAEVRTGEGTGAPHDAADRWVRIWVEDQGIGIPPALLPRLFQMFTRGTRKYEGTGIGLALVRKVVERMGGKVGVRSEPGKGSRFWVELRPVEGVAGTASDPGQPDGADKQ